MGNSDETQPSQIRALIAQVKGEERQRVLGLVEKELDGWMDVIAEPGNPKTFNLWAITSTFKRLKQQVEQGIEAKDVE